MRRNIETDNANYTPKESDQPRADAKIEDNERKAGSGEIKETPKHEGNAAGDAGEKTDNKNKEERETDRKAFQNAYKQSDVDKIKDTEPGKYQSMQEANKMAVYDELKEANGGKTCWDEMSDEERNKMKEENPYRANALEGDYDDRHPYDLEPENQTAKMKEDVQKNQATRLDGMLDEISPQTRGDDNPYSGLVDETEIKNDSNDSKSDTTLSNLKQNLMRGAAIGMAAFSVATMGSDVQLPGQNDDSLTSSFVENVNDTLDDWTEDMEENSEQKEDQENQLIGKSEADSASGGKPPFRESLQDILAGYGVELKTSDD